VAAEKPSAVSGALRRPFAEQVAFFRRKLGNLVPTSRWDDMTGAAHDTGFMVAGAQKADLLMDLAVSVDRAIAEGKSLDAFRKDFEAAVERHDWHGWTGEDTTGGRAWRTRTIYRTNTYVSYSAGRFAQLTAANWPLWVYRHGGSEHPRHEHLHVFDGLILPPDHPFWKKFYPPSDWGCSCYVLGARSMRAARRLGGDPDKNLPEGWDTPDPKTGEPAGVGKGWGYAPGASVAGPVTAMAEKVPNWDYDIGKAFFDELPAATRDAIGEAYRRLPSVADDVRRYARRALGEAGGAYVQPIWTIGPVPSSRAAEWLPGASYDFSLDVDAVEHVKARSRAQSGQLEVDVEDYGMLPAIVQYGVWSDGGLSRGGEQLVKITLRLHGLLYVASFERRPSGKTLALVSFEISKTGAGAK
jgi:uncharacterized protein with gpF-like domain